MRYSRSHVRSGNVVAVQMFGSVLKRVGAVHWAAIGGAALLAGLLLPRLADEGGACVRVYYDASRDPAYQYGKTAATFLRNLLGHFPEFRQIVEPIESYRKGQLEECRASFYIGTFYDNAIPQDFLDDYAATKRRVAWIGYSVWRLDADRLK